MILLELFWICFRTSLLSFGGVYGALPELRRVFVEERGWVTLDQLMECYVVGQFVPGPNMVIATLLGRRVAGMPGACAAFLGTYAAPMLLIALTATLFQRYRRVAWVRRVELALRPLVIAFMGAAALAIARDQLTHRWLVTLLVSGLGATLYARGWLRPLPLMAVSGATYWLLFVGFADRLP